MSTSGPDVANDLAAIQADLHGLLVHLSPAEWERATASAGWTVRHQVRHLAQGEELGRLAAMDPAAFVAEVGRMLEDLAAVEAATTAGPAEPTEDLIRRWHTAAEGLRRAVGATPPDGRIAWVTGPMSRASFLTARVMETFAHGHDIAGAVGGALPADRALPHVAHLGVATRAFAYTNRGLPVPATAVRVEVEGAAGEVWTWGPADAPDLVQGTALDFCLLVTQRTHRLDTALRACGPHAEEWLTIAQCFAGPPSDGPTPRHS